MSAQHGDGGRREGEGERKGGGGGGERLLCVVQCLFSRLALFTTQFVPIMGINVQH